MFGSQVSALKSLWSTITITNMLLKARLIVKQKHLIANDRNLSKDIFIRAFVALLAAWELSSGYEPTYAYIIANIEAIFIK